MSRLIDADKLINILKDRAENEAICGYLTAYDVTNSIIDEIDEQPTAVDVDKVVEQLEEERKLAYADFNKYVEEVSPCLDAEYDDSFQRGLERAIMVDKADVDETNQTASIQNISHIFEQTQVVPETDALFFSKVAQAAQKTELYHTETASTEYTSENVFAKLKHILAAGKLRRYKANGSLIMYVSSDITLSICNKCII